MPPRKPNVSLTTATNDEATPVKERDGINIEDLSLPKTMVQRLAKGVLPPNTQIHKDAILAMQKGATVFINHLAFQADSLTQSTNRKTIPPPAISDALRDLEFEQFIPRVEAELKKYNEMQTGKRNAYRRKVKEEKKDGVRGEKVEGDSSLKGDDGEEDDGEDRERATKRVRRSSLDEGDESTDGTATRADTSPSAQLRNGNVKGPLELMDPPDEEGDYNGNDDDDGDDGDDGDDDDDDQEAEDGEADEEEPDEEDDEDEYPDEGRRLSSLEQEPYEDHDPRKERALRGDGSDVSMSGDEGSD